MSAMLSPYHFTDPFAKAVLETASSVDTSFACKIPGIGMSEVRQAIWIEQKLKDAFMIRNPKGQTLLYCLLRFTVNNYVREIILYSATVEQLATKNTNCGSTALMGFVYGEYENPRMTKDYKMRKIIDNANINKPGVADILSIPNNLSENCYTFYMPITRWQH
jgi:hypothetical protein